jgi:dipeptidase D
MSDDPFADLAPAPVWHHFADLCRIPRGSGNERAAAAFVLAVAERSGLSARQDEAGNVIVSRPASPGREDAAKVVLQGHLDMVCEQNAGGTHDFLRDPIRPVRRGEWIGAAGTTLGADNGIGVAMALAVLGERDRSLPPIEALFTVDEETGLHGANGIARDLVTGRVLLNLDSEEEGVLTIGCAGGQNTLLTAPAHFKDLPPGRIVMRIAVAGLRGGHSGLDIHEGRGNAIRLLARVLFDAAECSDLRLAALEGGSKHNAIPREASAVVSLPERSAVRLVRRVGEFEPLFRAELAGLDDGVTVRALPTGSVARALPRPASRRLLGFLLALPHGAAGMSRAVKGLVETSSNLAVVTLAESGVRVLTSQRSSVESRLDEIAAGVRGLATAAGFAASHDSRYPAWTPRPDSPLLARAKRIFAARHGGAEPGVKAVHAGLECGVLGEKFPGLDMLSFGPDIRGAHSPDERVNAPSVARVHDYLLDLLATAE